MIKEWLEKKGITYGSNYYTYIKKWEALWRNEAEHLNDTFFNGKSVIKRKRYSLNMPKKVVEDWASMFGEHHSYNVSNEDNRKIIDEIFEKTNFWTNINNELEKGFAYGTLGCLVRSDLQMQNISYAFITADMIYPIKVVNGVIQDCAFISTHVINDKLCYLVETHTLLDNGNYQIENELVNEEGLKIDITLLGNIAEEFISEVKLFHIFKPNLANNIKDNNGLGLSIYHMSNDVFVGADMAYDIFVSDMRLGKKMVFMSESMLGVGKNGEYLIPQESNQELFRYTAELGDETNTKIQEFNPTLRVNESEKAIQQSLDMISFKVGFGTKFYQFNAGTIVTATQYSGDRQELLKYVKKHFKSYSEFLKGIIDATLQLLGKADEVIIPFEDSIVFDDETMKANDLLLINAGIMQAWEYRVKWLGEDEQTAKEKAGDFI